MERERGEHQRAISKRGGKHCGGEGSRVPIPGPERRERPMIKDVELSRSAGNRKDAIGRLADGCRPSVISFHSRQNLSPG